MEEEITNTVNNETNKTEKIDFYTEEEEYDDEDNEVFEVSHPIKNELKIAIKKLYFKNSSIKIKISDDTDLVPGKYEGGVKLWECAIDLLEFLPSYLNSIENKNLLNKIITKNATCLELGCGHGLPGLYCLASGMRVVFQDFNLEVLNSITRKYIKNLTKHNKTLNLSLTENKDYFYVSGDWMDIDTTVSKSNNECINLFNQKFDLILSADTIYNTENYESFHLTLQKYLSKNGKCLISSKYFYFGVGGGVNQFCDFLDDKKIFSYTKVNEIRNGFSNIRIILEVFFK